MSSTLDSFDVVLALTLAVVTQRVLFARDLHQSIMMFIVFGLLLAIAWCRLEAVDVALAEAAIGAGLTGALFLNTLASTQREGRDALSRETSVHQAETVLGMPPSRGAQRWAARLMFGLAVVLVGAWLLSIVVPLAAPGLAPRMAMDQSMQRSGVTNPVTAVLLNFRAYDTLLEVAVLLAAAFATLFLLASAERATNEPAVGPVLASFVKVILPLVVLVATYVLWVGTKAPGGAFQAGAMLAASGVLLIVTGAQPPSFARPLWRVLLCAGLAVFLVVGLGGMLAGRFLEYPSCLAEVLIMLIETALTVSIALVLVLLFGATCGSGVRRVPETVSVPPTSRLANPRKDSS